MNFSDEDIGLTSVQYTPPAQSAPASAPKGGLSDSDIGLSDADIGLNEQPQSHFGEWGKAFSDIPSEIGKQYSGAWQGVKEGLGPSGKGAEGPLASTLKTGAGLLNAAYLGSGVGPAVVGAARSLIGHPMAEAEHAIGSTIAPDIAAKDNPEEMYQTAAGNAETALGAMGRVPGAPAPNLVPSAVRRVITPNPISAERQAAVDALRQSGVEPTAGMVTGSPAIRRAESTLGNAPFAGGAYARALDRVNSQFTRHVGNSFGEDVERITPEVLERARSRLGDQFESAAQNMTIVHDPQFGNDLASISRELMAEGLSEPEIRRIEAQMGNVQNGFVTTQFGRSGNTRGEMAGNVYQSLTRNGTPLARAIEDPNPNIAYYATRIRSALDDAMERSANRPGTRPGVGARQAMEDLRGARRQWFNMLAAQGATTGAGELAGEGIVTPQKLRQFLTNSNDKKTSYALGRSDLARVARAGNLVTTGLPDSNTAQRGWLTAIPSALIGGAAMGEPMTGILAGAAAPGLTGRVLMSRPIQRYLMNQRMAGQQSAIPPATLAGPQGTSVVPTAGRNIAPWQVPSITPRAAQQLRQRFPWLATGEIPHFGDDQQRAHGGRVNPANINHEPTEAQKKSGNYAKDHIKIHGLDITIENAKGKMRRGVDKGGKPWEVKMPAHYGYIKRTTGKDGDHVDVYLGAHLKSPHVFVVDQLNAETGKFDEHKCFLGFASKAQATRAYHAAFSDGKSHERLGHMSEMSIADFKHWLDRGDTTKPLAA